MGDDALQARTVLFGLKSCVVTCSATLLTAKITSALRLLFSSKKAGMAEQSFANLAKKVTCDPQCLEVSIVDGD